jgi:hypothetical protein
MALPAHNVSDSVALQLLVEASRGFRCGGSCIAIRTAVEVLPSLQSVSVSASVSFYYYSR